MFEVKSKETELEITKDMVYTVFNVYSDEEGVLFLIYSDEKHWKQYRSDRFCLPQEKNE